MNDGKLSQAQKEAFANWINQKSQVIGKCSICGHRSWTVMDHFFDLPIYRGGSVVIGGGPSYPSVGIVCTNCGNTQMINAVISGIIQTGEDDQTDPKDEVDDGSS